jgi:hypothetical protein
MSALATDPSGSVESVSARIAELVRERQELRFGGAGTDVLERNRRLIVELQRDLAHALIERYHPHVRAA